MSAFCSEIIGILVADATALGSLHIQRTKEKRGNEGGGGRATLGKIEEKTGDLSLLSSVSEEKKQA